MSPTDEQAPRLIDCAEVQHQTGFGRSKIGELVRDKNSDFPKPLHVMRHRRWVASEVAAWINRQIERRDAAGAGGE